MSAVTGAVAAFDSSIVVLNRKVLDGPHKGQILPKQVIAKAEDGSSEEYNFDGRGRVYRMVRYNKSGIIALDRGFPAGTSLHELGLHELNKEVQRQLAKNRREHGGMGDIAA